MKTITRRTKYTGQHVRVTFRDGSHVDGTMDGWGTQILSIRPDPDQQLEGTARSECAGWKIESFYVGKVSHVEEI